MYKHIVNILWKEKDTIKKNKKKDRNASKWKETLMVHKKRGEKIDCAKIKKIKF